MDDRDFMIKQQEAVKRMKEFAERSSKIHNNGDDFIPPTPHFVSINKSKEQPNKENEPLFNSEKNGLDIPLLNKLKSDKDSGIILGIILLLLCDNTDKLTLIALLYILL